jgi:hypothetical protein
LLAVEDGPHPVFLGAVVCAAVAAIVVAVVAAIADVPLAELFAALIVGVVGFFTFLVSVSSGWHAYWGRTPESVTLFGFFKIVFREAGEDGKMGDLHTARLKILRQRQQLVDARESASLLREQFAERKADSEQHIAELEAEVARLRRQQQSSADGLG